jgi:transcriptional regulator with XRE-family HTH domain
MSTQIKKHRIKTGLTQEEAAVKLGIHPTTLNKYEGGSRTPSGKVLPAMAKLFGVSLDSLLNENQETSIALSINNSGKEEENMAYRDKYESLMEKYIAMMEENSILKEELLKKAPLPTKKLS